MRTEFLYISVLRVASGPRVKLASCKSALNPTVVCSTDRSKAVVLVLVLLFVALWFILRGYLLYVFSCAILFLCFSVLLVLRLPRLGKRELILVFFCVCSVCACLDLSVFSSSWGLGRAAVCDLGTPWTFHLPFLLGISFWVMFVGTWCSIFGRAHRSLTVDFLLLQHFSCFVLSSPCRCCISVISWFFVFSEM